MSSSGTASSIRRMGTLCESKHDVDGRLRINGTAALLGRLETNLLGGLDGGLIEAMAKAAHYANHADSAGRRELDFEQHIAFDPKFARLVRVDRRWLVQHFDRSDLSPRRGR